MQKAAQALIIGGLISLGIGLAISLLIGYLLEDNALDTVARQMTVSIGINVAGVIFGVGFPVAIVGIVLAWMSKPEPEAERLDELDEEDEWGEEDEWEEEASE